MVYAGQELGEKAEDAEGFSGLDGRTTIFDYWSVPSLRRWMNGGKCNNELLSDEEVRLRDTYKKVLNAAKNEPAISRGQFFDVMYVNYNNPTLDPHRQYAYLRKDGDEVIVIVNLISAPKPTAKSQFHSTHLTYFT